jgi:palmitoyltransferase
MRGQRSLLLGPARLCLRLLLLLGYRRRCPPLLRGLVQRWRYGKVCLRSLLYNSFGGSDTAVDAAFEPVYWLVDNVIRWFGVVSAGALRARKEDVLWGEGTFLIGLH